MIELIEHPGEVLEPPVKRPEPPRLKGPNPQIIAYSIAAVIAVGILIFTVFYLKYARMTDARLAAGPFSGTLNIYAAPHTVSVGESASADDIAVGLRRSGYTTSPAGSVGSFRVSPGAIEIFPGHDSNSGSPAGRIEFSSGKVTHILSLPDRHPRDGYTLEPALITNISDRREQRRLVHFSDIPPVLVQAVTSAEDKHFFHHTGFDLLRIVKAAWVDMRSGRKEQGASTLTMQLARGFWLDPDKRWTRKARELLITMHLEHRLTKQQIFEDYANQVYLGRQASFSINGFGEAARAYYDKNLSQLTTGEAALLAGIVQRPSYFNPFRYPQRARERRDIVLSLMKANGYLTSSQYDAAIAEPVHIVPGHTDSSANHYLVDLVSEEVQSSLGDRDKEARAVFTTLDPNLQRSAEEAVRIGMENVDRQLKHPHAAGPSAKPQVALVAIDPHTGEIKALIGGRNYDTSQLNHALARRQPGSVFKPFVYAGALETAIAGGQHILTPATLLDDSPTSFAYTGGVYQPANFGNEYMGEVTMRTALAHSLNAATVSLAQQAGLTRIAALARRAGLDVKPTPSLALGSYEATPIDIAGAYTIFANSGMRVTPTAISSIRAGGGAVIGSRQSDARPALDPRIAYLMVNLMQEVLNSGTGAGVRARGFSLPAAGKTGTSRDGWFAGFTTDLLCVVWVGFDDNHDLNLEGAKSALPIWTEFMKRATQFTPYRSAHQFSQPAGIEHVDICDDSGQLAEPECPRVHSEVFLDGTEPAVKCELHSPSRADDANNTADRVIEVAPIKH